MLNMILVDDHRMVRDCLKTLLSNADTGINIMAEATSAEELFSLLQEKNPEIVLMDINLPGVDGLAATKFIRVHYPAVKVIILSMMNDENYVAKALDAGAAGYLSKSASKQELLHAIQMVVSGIKYISPDISLHLLDKVRAKPAPAAYKKETLSERELAILRLIAEGYTNEEIADKLFNSKRTIETHRQNILEKTKSKNTAHLIVYAARHRLLD